MESDEDALPIMEVPIHAYPVGPSLFLDSSNALYMCKSMETIMISSLENLSPSIYAVVNLRAVVQTVCSSYHFME